PVPPRRRLRRSHPQGRETGRPAGSGADQVRTRHQPQDGESGRHRRASHAARPRGRGHRMKRRTFITLLGGAAAWPLAARAQQPERMRGLAIIMLTADDADGQGRITALREGLEKLGWTEGRNLRIDTRWAAGDTDRMRTYVTELVQANPDAILANGSPAVSALRQETRSIPIVFAAVIHPPRPGLVFHFAPPRSHITRLPTHELTALL